MITPPSNLPPDKETTIPSQQQVPIVANKRNRTIWWLTSGILIIALAWFLLWLFYFRYYEFTDDAYVNGNMINVNAAISGSVVSFYADDTDLVMEGQLLVQLDCTPYQLAYERELSTLAASVLQIKQLYDNVLAQKANVESRKTTLSKASYDFDNRQALVKSQAIPNEDFIHSRDDYLIAQLQHAQAEFQLQMAKDAVGDTSLADHPDIKKQKASVREAYYKLKHCAIYAPATGYVAQRQVDVGQWVTPNIPLMAIIPTDYMWVDANYKETQLTHMRIGQPAQVWFDIYGRDVTFEGTVIGIASGSGSVFSLIPPQNATGNWIKIVQRLPVRIAIPLDKMQEHPLRLGISAEVSVDITKRDLPMLAQVPSTKIVGKTQVFDLDFQEVDKIIDEIINSPSTSEE